MKRLMMLVLGAFVITGLATQHLVAAETKPKGRTTKKKTTAKKKPKAEAKQEKAKKAEKKRLASSKPDRKPAECRYDCNSHAKGQIWFECASDKENFIKCARKSLDEAEKCNRACRR